MGIKQTRRFRVGPLDIEILRTNVLLSLHANARHLPAGADPLPVGVPVDIGVANAEGAAENFARRDHIHNHPAALGFDLHHDHDLRMLGDIFSGGPGYVADDYGEVQGENACTLQPFQVPYTLTLDRIGFLPRVQAGNLEAGIYADMGDTPVGGALLVSTGAFACPAVGTKQEQAIADTQLQPGLYWYALYRDDATVEFAAHGAGYFAVQLGGTLGCYNTWAVGLADPCGAVGAIGTSDAMYGRVKSIP